MAIERFPVEASHIMMFARSVADPNPIYYEEDYAKLVMAPLRTVAHHHIGSDDGHPRETAPDSDSHH